jgi:pimeloyl-ACP methyl ester carboxylesterase
MIELPTLGGKQLWADVFLHTGWRIQQNVVTGHHRLLDERDVRRSVGSFAHCMADFRALAGDRQPQSEHLVLLLHGIGRSKDAFAPMQRALREAGYEAHGVNYPSTLRSLDDHAQQVEQLLDRAEGVEQLSIVAHSMGGIVSRVLMARKGAWRRRIDVHRIVMIGTPNQGSRLASVLAERVPGASSVGGPAFDQIRTDGSGQLPPLAERFGLIAGGRGDPRGYNPLLDGDDDSYVSVEETHLPGAEDRLVVPQGVHSVLMMQPTVIEATVRYLQTGRFSEA